MTEVSEWEAVETLHSLPWLWNIYPGICGNHMFTAITGKNSSNINIFIYIYIWENIKGKPKAMKNLFLAKPIIYARWVSAQPQYEPEK